MQIRGFRKEDVGALGRIMALAFGDSAEEAEKYFDPEKNPRVEPDQVHIVEEDGQVRASATVLPLEAYFGGKPLSVGGIAAVATHPAYRRRGYAGGLMRAVLEDMCGRGIHLSLLSPFSHGFYRAYGWELATEGIGYTLKPNELPVSDEQRFIRDYLEDDLPEMRRLLEVEASRHSCGVRRSEGRWHQVLNGDDDWSKNFQAAVYEREGQVGGYLIYKQSGHEEQTPPRRLTVYEVVGHTPGARAGLLSFAAAYDPLEFEVKYETSRGEPLHPYLNSSYVDARVHTDMMLRIVSVEGALSLLRRGIGDPLVLEVSDDVIPENAGEYTVGGGEIVRGAEAGERVSLGVRQLAQLYAGYLPARELARHRLVQVSSERALECLEEIFPVGDPWVFRLDRF